MRWQHKALGLLHVLSVNQDVYRFFDGILALLIRFSLPH